MIGFSLVVGGEPPVPDPAWGQIEEAVRALGPENSVTLVRSDGTHIRADGARVMYTIVFYETAKAAPLVIGRRASGRRRGRTTLRGNRVLVSSLEWWNVDGIGVFRAFHAGQPLADAFALRDARTAYTDAEIRIFLERQ